MLTLFLVLRAASAEPQPTPAPPPAVPLESGGAAAPVIRGVRIIAAPPAGGSGRPMPRERALRPGA